MNGQEASKQTFGAKLCKVISVPIRYFYSLMAALATSLTIGMTTYCEKIKKDMDADTIFSNMAEIVIKIAFYVGALITIGGIFSLIKTIMPTVRPVPFV